MSRKNKVFREEVTSRIGGDRRHRHRYEIDLNLQYKVLGQNRVCESGSGKTINFSGGGIALEIDGMLNPGASVELAIAWPVLLNRNCALKLVVTGKVVRSSIAMTAVRMERYEFRTHAVRALQAQAAAHSV